MKKTPRYELRYKIVRIYSLTQNERTIRTDVTKQHAIEHCCNPESAYTTCRKPINRHRTEQRGPWYDIRRPIGE